MTVFAALLTRNFPREIDNTYRGRGLGLWLFVAFVLVKLLMGVNSTINTRSVATGADGIVLDTLSAGGAALVVQLFALLALSHLVLTVQGVVVIRYRAMIPLMYLLLLAEHAARRSVVLLHPIERSDAASFGSALNLTLLAVLLLGFLMSLLNRTGSTLQKP